MPSESAKGRAAWSRTPCETDDGSVRSGSATPHPTSEALAVFDFVYMHTAHSASPCYPTEPALRVPADHEFATLVEREEGETISNGQQEALKVGIAEAEGVPEKSDEGEEEADAEGQAFGGPAGADERCFPATTGRGERRTRCASCAMAVTGRARADAAGTRSSGRS
jgi:hypothetical protein